MAQFPEQFGKYVLLRKIARGGMAEIFLAKNVGAEGFEKDLVIKRILPHFSEDEEFVTMFIDEASIASKLAHANIVQIYDFDQVDGAYYIAMEYVNGKDLKDVIGDGLKANTPLNPAQVVFIISELAKALHYAHTKQVAGQPLNIVHRDVSPQNAMISFAGEVKLMDFGIAKAASRSTHTVAGTVKGKCAYMSPEQAKGKQLDGRSDVFALGVVAWEMLTGKRLFLAESDFMTLTNVLKQEAPPPSALNAMVTPELDAILLKALEKEVDNRYASGQAFERALTRWFYTHADLDQAKLAPYMKAMYASDIATNLAKQAEERTMFMSATGQGEQGGGQPAPSPDEATRVLSGGADIQAMSTLMDGDLSAEKVAQLRSLAQKQRDPVDNDEATRMLGAMPAAVDNADATRMMPARSSITPPVSVPTSQPTHDIEVAPPPSKAWLWMLVALVVMAFGGVASWYFLVGPGATVPSVSDVGAQNTPQEPAPAEAVPEPSPTSVPETVARPTADKAVVAVTQPAAKPNPAAPSSTEQPAPSTKPVAKDAPPQTPPTPARDEPTIATPVASPSTMPSGPPQTQIMVTCNPDGQVSTDVGTPENQGMAWVVKGLNVGQSVKVTCFKKGYATQIEEVVAKHGVQIPFTLRRVVTGLGKIVINAKPWAKCSVAGKRNATTPIKLSRVRPGRYRVVCKQGGQTKNAVVKVTANRTATKFFKFPKK